MQPRHCLYHSVHAKKSIRHLFALTKVKEIDQIFQMLLLKQRILDSESKVCRRQKKKVSDLPTISLSLATSQGIIENIRYMYALIKNKRIWLHLYFLMYSHRDKENNYTAIPEFPYSTLLTLLCGKLLGVLHCKQILTTIFFLCNIKQLYTESRPQFQLRLFRAAT